MSLKVYIMPTLKMILVQAVLNTVVYQMLIVYTNVLVNSAVLQELKQFVTPLLIHVDTRASGTSSAIASNRNTLYNVIAVKRHIMPVDLPESENISGAEINSTVCAANSGVLCWNLAESKSVLKMCISKHCDEVTGFLSWIGTYRISCV